MSGEASYIGNSSRSQLSQGQNINYVPIGAELAGYQAGLPLNDDAFRKFNNYSVIDQVRNNVSSNYNALQVTAAKQAGRFNFSAAYTFSKALGLGTGNDGFTSHTLDPLDARNRNYGPQFFDRTHQWQFSYIYQLPGLPATANWFAKGVVNGWAVSGITVVESGAPIRNVGFGSSNGLDLSGRAIEGSSDFTVAPQLVCDPTANLKTNQLYNANCFTAPTPGHNGTFELPYIHGPRTTDTDLSAHKEFRFKERYTTQFRFEMFNAFNHPLWTGYNNSLDFNKNTLQVQNAQNAGFLNFKTGHRTIQLVAKFYF